MRLITLCVLFLLLAFTHSAHAQSTNVPDDSCRKVVVTSDLVQCFERAWKGADKQLNNTYAKVQGVLAPKERKELVQAQRIWMRYRDATCKAEYDLYDGATGGPPARLACLEAETRAREASLQRSYGWRVEKFGK